MHTLNQRKPVKLLKQWGLSVLAEKWTARNFSKIGFKNVGEAIEKIEFSFVGGRIKEVHDTHVLNY